MVILYIISKLGRVLEYFINTRRQRRAGRILGKISDEELTNEVLDHYLDYIHYGMSDEKYDKIQKKCWDEAVTTYFKLAFKLNYYEEGNQIEVGSMQFFFYIKFIGALIRQ